MIKNKFLEELQWWNWDEEKIFRNLERLISDTGLAELMDKELDEGAFYHGTKAHLEPGDLLESGYQSNSGKGKQANFVYLTATMNATALGAELALGKKRR